MIKIIQIGEGNFLRTFVDAYFDTLNKEKVDEYEVNIIKPISRGNLDNFKKQNNKYHIVLRGVLNGKASENFYKIDCVKSAINPFVDLSQFYSLAEDKDLKILVSNTTEAGICFNEYDKYGEFENVTYPAKLTQFLYRRFTAGLNGIYLLPVELIDNNADELLLCVNRYIDLWELPEEFKQWNLNENFYCNTLVDRIVSGYPKDETTKEHLFNLIGESDELVSIGEPFGLWAIENKGDLSSLIKEGHHNIDVVLTNNIKYYKKRKVRILNGSHTNLVAMGLWHNKVTVFDVMQDKAMLKFIKDTLKYEIIPFVSDNIQETTDFANSVIERFKNPYLNHQLESISLNSISKWVARDFPSFDDYYEKYKQLPRNLTIGFSYLIALYKNVFKENGIYYAHLPSRAIVFKDDTKILDYFIEHSIDEIINNKEIWGVDFSKYQHFNETIKNIVMAIAAGSRVYE